MFATAFLIEFVLQSTKKNLRATLREFICKFEFKRVHT